MKGRNFSPSLYLSFVIQHFAKKTKEVKKSVHICMGIQNLLGLLTQRIEQQMYVRHP